MNDRTVTRTWARGTLQRRYKRFLADVELDNGTPVTAHVANPGAMTGLADPGLSVWLEHRPATARRKLAWSWTVVESASGALVGVNTGTPNRLVGAALRSRRLPEFSMYGGVCREQNYGVGCRVDFLLQEPGLPDLYLEVKSVTLSRRPGRAEFPDARTTRGARHMAALAEVASAGARAAVLYVVQREDCNRFDVANDIDPAYAAAAQAARDAGVEMYCRHCRMRPERISLAGPLRIGQQAGQDRC